MLGLLKGMPVTPGMVKLMLSSAGVENDHLNHVVDRVMRSDMRDITIAESGDGYVHFEGENATERVSIKVRVIAKSTERVCV